jgi:hypothetical protein
MTRMLHLRPFLFVQWVITGIEGQNAALHKRYAVVQRACMIVATR